MPNDPKKILIGEKDITISNIYKEKLESLGFEVVLAFDGQEVIDKSKIDVPDLILMELVLPKKNGFEVLAELRADKNLKDTPIFIISEDNDTNDVKKALQMGASLFFVKNQARLIDIVQNVEGVLSSKKSP